MKSFSVDKGPRHTIEEYNQLMAIIKKNYNNSQHFVNATDNITLSSKILVALHLNLCWIIDNGATYYVTLSTDLLNPKKLL